MASKTKAADPVGTIPAVDLAYVPYTSLVVVSNVRHIFDRNALKELAASIKQHGLMQPLEVVPTADDLYRIVAGERRFRAIGMLIEAGDLPDSYEVLCTIAAATTVDGIDDTDLARVVLVRQMLENLQREDLHPLEEAKGYRALLDDFSLKQGDLAAQVGKSASHITKRLSLLLASTKLIALFDDGLVSLDVIYDLSRLDGDRRAKTETEIVNYPADARRAVDRALRNQESDKARQKFIGKIESLGVSIVDKQPDESVFVASFNANTIGDYVPAKTHSVVVNQYNVSASAYRPMTAADRKKAEKIAADGAAAREAAAAERAADPVLAWEDAYFDVCDRFDDIDADNLLVWTIEAIGGRLQGVSDKEATNELVAFIIREMPRVDFQNYAAFAALLDVSYKALDPEEVTGRWQDAAWRRNTAAQHAVVAAWANVTQAKDRVRWHLVARWVNAGVNMLVDNGILSESVGPRPAVPGTELLPPAPEGYQVFYDPDDPFNGEAELLTDVEYAERMADLDVEQQIADDQANDEDVPEDDDYDEDASHEGTEHPEFDG